MELPPRARRIPTAEVAGAIASRTTSACAENTFIELAIAGYIRNYLRVRGEYFTAFTQSGSCRELPPRARRIPTRENLIQQNRGTTSACAENTTPDPLNAKTHGNYLRVRGEYRTCGACERFCGELPPRARRIHCVRESIRVKTGTTSACAENTGRYSCWSSRIRNYLRVRGEYPISRNRKGSLSELPPRARRILMAGVDIDAISGTTSACAENTVSSG